MKLFIAPMWLRRLRRLLCPYRARYYETLLETRRLRPQVKRLRDEKIDLMFRLDEALKRNIQLHGELAAARSQAR